MKQLKLINFDDIYKEENRITNQEPVKSGEFTEDGIYSSKIFGNYNGEDDIKDIDTLGWIVFDPYYIINPLLYNMLKKCIPQLEEIINYQKTINKDGSINEEENKIVNISNDEMDEDINEENKIFSNKKICEHQYTGIRKFKENFNFFLETYTDKNKFLNEYNFINKNKDKLFINKIPIFSHKLRAAVLIGKTLNFAEINNCYNLILKYTNEITNGLSDIAFEFDLITLPILYQIQVRANIIFNKIINDYLKGKKGFFRKNIMGARINYIARCVITPLTGYALDELAIPYLVFAELYKFPLINLISKVKNINYNQALAFWEKGILGYNDEFYNYMNEMIKKTKNGCKILLNRNPSISIESIMLLKLVLVKKDYNDLTLSLSNNIVTPFSADYDGDVLNLIPVFDNKLKEVFELLSPNNFIISRNDGKFNNKFNLMKDQILGIFILNN